MAPSFDGEAEGVQSRAATSYDTARWRVGHGGRVNDGNGGERVGRGEEESGADPGERRRGRGSERGEWERGPRRRGVLAPLSSPSPVRGCGGDDPCSDPGRGNREGAREEVGWAGGAGVRCRWATGPVGGKACSPFFFFSLTVSVFCFLFICLFPFLFYFI